MIIFLHFFNLLASSGVLRGYTRYSRSSRLVAASTVDCRSSRTQQRCPNTPIMVLVLSFCEWSADREQNQNCRDGSWALASKWHKTTHPSFCDASKMANGSHVGSGNSLGVGSNVGLCTVWVWVQVGPEVAVRHGLWYQIFRLGLKKSWLWCHFDGGRISCSRVSWFFALTWKLNRNDDTNELIICGKNLTSISYICARKHLLNIMKVVTVGAISVWVSFKGKFTLFTEHHRSFVKKKWPNPMLSFGSYSALTLTFSYVTFVFCLSIQWFITTSSVVVIAFATSISTTSFILPAHQPHLLPSTNQIPCIIILGFHQSHWFIQ
jgi:hypothetical protein